MSNNPESKKMEQWATRIPNEVERGAAYRKQLEAGLKEHADAFRDWYKEFLGQHFEAMNAPATDYPQTVDLPSVESAMKRHEVKPQDPTTITQDSFFKPNPTPAPLPVSEREREEQQPEEELWAVVEECISNGSRFYHNTDFLPAHFIEWMRKNYTLTRKKP